MDPGPLIASYGLLGDGRTAALVSRDGSVDWWCTPRFDSPSVLGRLLDPSAGHWAVRPTAPAEVRRRYLPGTLVLASELRTDGGAVELVDALALDREEPHRLGRSTTPPTLVRQLRGLAGEVEVDMELVPRFDYGRQPVRPRRSAEGVELPDPSGRAGLLLTGDRPVELRDGGVSARLRIRAGERVGFVLTATGAAGAGSSGAAGSSPVVGPSGVAGSSAAVGPSGTTGAAGPVRARVRGADKALDDTISTWRAWSDAHDRYQGAYADLVRRSSLVLQALTYQPRGAIVAAATTSLPEVPDGEANWDYRYAWLRDAAMVMRALWIGACPDEADRYFAWMADVVDADDGRLQVVYGVDGERELRETELPHLRGYRGHRPVRVGNDAWVQRQLDVPGEVLDAAWTLHDRLDGAAGAEPLVRLVGDLADLVADTWTEPDAGIWEGREGERHYLSSKLMCWVALDRALRLAPQLGLTDRTGRWATERDRVRRYILTDGWHDGAGAFTGAIGSDHHDASVLLMPLVGFLPADDPRMAATVEAVERELSDDGLVRRWTGADGEGAFVMCSYWLAQCHAQAGRVDRAAEIFDRVTGHANDLGLLAEMVDPRTGDQLGNVPQALSHAAQVCAAWAIDQARRGPQADEPETPTTPTTSTTPTTPHTEER